MSDAMAALQELKNRGITISDESVLAPESTSLDEVKKFTESTFKGATRGIVKLVGGWGNLYDKIKENKEPSALSSAGIMKAVRDLGGPDLQQIQGYRGASNFAEAAAPQVATTALGMPGLFPRTALGLTGEAAVAGSTGLLAESIAPDSPLAQFAIQATPYAVGGAVKAARNSALAPEGVVPKNSNELLNVGRMTPGEMTGSRPQLAKEAKAEASTKIEERGNVFRQAQAVDAETFLDNVFKRATASADTPEVAATGAINAFSNYGKSLASKLRRDANVDFKDAKVAGGIIDPSPVLKAVQEKLSSIPPETPGFAGIESAINKIKDEYFIPEKQAVIEPSAILGPTGQPARVNITPGTPEGVQKISVERLQKNLSAWGEAVYSGKADFGKGNIFEGVAPGQVKGIAMAVLNGFRQSLDEAIDAGVPGAEKLKAARDNFKTNLASIEEFSNRPLAKYFDVPTSTALTAEDVLAKLNKAKPSERTFLVDVLSKSPDGGMILDTAKRTQFEALLDKGRKTAAGAPEGSPSIDLKVVLSELNNKKGDFDWLFPNAADKADAALAIQWLQKTQKSATESSGGVRADAYASTRGVGGTAQQGLILGELSSIVRAILDDPKAMANVVFDPETVKKLAAAQRKGVVGKAADIAKDLTGIVARTAVRSGPRIDTSKPSLPEEPQQQPNQPTPEEALQQLKAMGIPVE
jgi:hypothetical protein